jgi:hypothetical protein
MPTPALASLRKKRLPLFLLDVADPQGRFASRLQTGVTSLDWMSYPVLRFAEHPEVTRSCCSGLTSRRPAPARR